jgi:hypothetical protein
MLHWLYKYSILRTDTSSGIGEKGAHFSLIKAWQHLHGWRRRRRCADVGKSGRNVEQLNGSVDCPIETPEPFRLYRLEYSVLQVP